MRGPVLARRPVRAKDDLVPVGIERVLGKVEMHIVAGERQLSDRPSRLAVLELAHLRVPGLSNHKVNLQLISENPRGSA